MKESETARLIGYLKARYPRAQWGPSDELTVAAWHMNLGDLPYGSVMEALAALSSGSAWPPDPSEIRGYIFDAAGLAPTPERAWGLVQKAIKRYDPAIPANERIKLPDPVAAAVKLMGGLNGIRKSERPDKERETFLRTYAGERLNAIRVQDPAALLPQGSAALAIDRSAK